MKKRKLLAALLALVMILSTTVVGMSAISVSAAEDTGKEIGVGQTDTLYVGDSQYYSLSPTYRNIASVSVTSSNPSVATAYSDGRGGANVYAKKAGVTKVTINLRTFDNNNNTSTQSASIYVTVLGVLAAPTNVRIQNSGTGFYVTWNKAAGAARYRVYYKRPSTSDWSWDTTSGSGNSMNLTSLWPGELYYIQVQSIDSNGKRGGISKSATMTHVRTTNLYSTAYNSNGTVTIKWESALGANGYAIAKKKSTDKSYTYYYVSGTSFTDKNVVGGALYYYQIRPYYSNGKSAAYAQWSNSKTITTLFKPTITNMNINASRLNINWNAIKGATSYKVAFKRSTDSAWNYRTTTARYYNVANPTKGAIYQVQVCPLNGSFAGPWSAVKTASLASPLAKPTLSGNTNSSRNYLSWNSISGAKSYQIAKKTTQQSSYTYLTTSSTFYNDYSFTDGKTYTYQVRAFNGSTYGPWSNVLTLKPPVDVPYIYLAESYSNRIQAEWYDVEGAAYYRVAYRKSTSSSWSYTTVYDTEFDLYYPDSNSKYYVSVYAVGENGTHSDWSDDITIYT